MKKARTFLFAALARALVRERVTSMVAWAEQFLRLPGSARSERFDSSITPWTRRPLEDVIDPFCRMMTFVKPIQSGGSVVGEAAVSKWISTETGGDVQMNYEDDEKADARWDKRTFRILQACEPVMRVWPAKGLRGNVQKGLIIFPHLNFLHQGVFTDKRVSSDSIRFQVNEEIHSWKPGRLEQAWGRTTAYWNSFIANISNASVKGDQLHQAHESGTMQFWEVKCPGCGLYHRMRTRWEDKRPDLGGLRYDADGCRREDGGYDYSKLEGSIRYQMPCGFLVHDRPNERRPLSLSGDYSEPTNKGAHTSHRSYTLEAVSVDYIPWLSLIQQKHKALKALKHGDPEPLKRYGQERECRFWDPEDRPLIEKIVVNTRLKKNRDGLTADPHFFARYFALDRQQGKLRVEFPHWWLVIRDVLENGDSLLVFEGKIETDDDVIATLDSHKCVRRCGVADSGDDTLHVYQFCLKYGISAIKGGKADLYAHQVPDEDDPRKTKTVYRIYSVEQMLYDLVDGQPRFENPDDEPRYWLYSKAGIRQRLDYLRYGKAVKWEVPGDVSEDYHKHMAGEELVEETNKRGYTELAYHAHTKRIDLRVCEAYIAMLMEMSGRIGAPTLVPQDGQQPGSTNAVVDEAGGSVETNEVQT